MTTYSSSRSSRTVRVFLSSTFRDFAEERDLLVKKVFPELRRRCRERQVELVDVDLRWGITEEQAQRGEVLPICLAEIDRSRPYFMGFIGDRYGWVPEHHQYDLSLLVEQPWLDEHRGGKSVTELEMLHGVLNNPQMKDRAFFYFRNSEYSQSKGGPYLSEGPDYSVKLEALKDRIRTSGFPVVENYPNPEALAEKVQEDLWKVIDEAFPAEDVPDPLTLERRKHEAYGGSRLGLYLGGKQYFQALDAAMGVEPFKPVLITGASGGGKSALIANWSMAYKEKHPETLEIVHYLGSGADAADPVKLVTRLLQGIARITGDELKLESDPQKILDALPEWLVRASSYAVREGKEWLILLDGLDKLSSLRDLRWWPGVLPPRVKLVVSCLDGEVQDEARKRMEWSEIKVNPLTDDDKKDLIVEYLGRYRKSLTPEQITRVQSHPLSGNPLFLRTLLEELRIFGVYEELEARMSGYLAAETIDGLFAKVFARVEEDNRAEDVRTAMEVLWGSLESFAEDELLAITGLVPAVWSPILNALSESLISTNGRLALGHDYFRKAVEDRFLTTEVSKQAVYKRLSDFCAEAMEREGRKANSPYVRRQAVRHFLMAEAWDEAANALSDLDHIESRIINREITLLIIDYNKTLELLPEAQAEAQIEKVRNSELERWAREITAYSQVWTQRRKIGKSAIDDSAPVMPLPPKSVERWSEERINKEINRIKNTPNPLDTVRAFSQFVATNVKALEKFSDQNGFVVQHAFNNYPAGAVHEASAKLLKEINKPIILRNWYLNDQFNPFPQTVRTLEGHIDKVNSVSISADGRFAITASDDKTVRFWCLDIGECLAILHGHTAAVTSVSISPNGSRAISGSADNTVRIWNLENGECLNIIDGHPGTVNSVTISADGFRAITVCNSILQVWDLESGERLHLLEGHQGTITSVFMSPDGLRAATGSYDSTVRVWDVDSGNCLRILECNSGWPERTVSMSPDAKRSVSGNADSIARVWDIESEECIRTLHGHTEVINCVSITADGHQAISGSDDSTLRLWDLESGVCLSILEGHTDSVKSVSISADGGMAISCGRDKIIRIWDLKKGGTPPPINRHSKKISSVSISSDRSRAFSGSDDSTARLWSLESGECLSIFKGHAWGSIFVSLCEKERAITGGDNTLRLWDLKSGECLRILQGHTKTIASVILSSDGYHALSGSGDETIRFWNLESGECLKVLVGHTGWVYSVDLSRDGSRAVSGSGDDTIRFWNLESGECLHILKGHKASITSVSLSSDCSRLISGSLDNTLCLWDLDSGNCIRTLYGHSDSILSVKIRYDGKYAISASADNTVRVWSLESNESSLILADETLKNLSASKDITDFILGCSNGDIKSYKVIDTKF